jgi:hypothetical protein
VGEVGDMESEERNLSVSGEWLGLDGAVLRILRRAGPRDRSMGKPRCRVRDPAAILSSQTCLDTAKHSGTHHSFRP